MSETFDKFLQFGVEFDKMFNKFFGYNLGLEKKVVVSAPNETVWALHNQQYVPTTCVCVRLAGISGGLAVALAAYGAHFVNDNPDLSAERKRAMEYANRHHFLNTIGMVLASVAARRPKLTAMLFLFGTIFFSGPSYAYAITADKRLRSLTPVGGVLAMLAWLSFIF